MILLEVILDKEKIPYVILNGNNLYKKIQYILFGKDKYRKYPTIKYELKDIEINIVKININKKDINKELFNYYISNERGSQFSAIQDKTIEKHYQKILYEQNFDFYRNLCETYGVKKLQEIVRLSLVYRVDSEWLSIYFDLPKYEIDFILNNLGTYFIFLEDGGNLWRR